MGLIPTSLDKVTTERTISDLKDIVWWISGYLSSGKKPSFTGFEDEHIESLAKVIDYLSTQKCLNEEQS